MFFGWGGYNSRAVIASARTVARLICVRLVFSELKRKPVKLLLKSPVQTLSCTLLRRFEHTNKPQHGWVVHCRSIAPPRCLNRLNLVPFLQYALCLDVELLQLVKKSCKEELWPFQVDSAAYNSSQIFYTDKVRNNQSPGLAVVAICATKINK